MRLLLPLALGTHVALAAAVTAAAALERGAPAEGGEGGVDACELGQSRSLAALGRALASLLAHALPRGAACEPALLVRASAAVLVWAVLALNALVAACSARRRDGARQSPSVAKALSAASELGKSAAGVRPYAVLREGDEQAEAAEPLGGGGGAERELWQLLAPVLCARLVASHRKAEWAATAGLPV